MVTKKVTWLPSVFSRELRVPSKSTGTEETCATASSCAKRVLLLSKLNNNTLNQIKMVRGFIGWIPLFWNEKFCAFIVLRFEIRA